MAEFLAIVVVAIMAIAFISGLVIWQVLVNGWVLSIIWGWLIVPIFGLQPLSVAHAIAVKLVAATVLSSRQEQESEKKKETAEILTNLFMELLGKPLLILGFAWVVKHYI